MIRSHAVYPRSLGVGEIVQAVKTGLLAVQIRRILYKPYQAKIVSKEAKFALFIETSLEARYFPGTYLAVAWEDVSAIEYAQHFVSHCSELVVQSAIYRVQIRDYINEFSLCDLPARPKIQERNYIFLALVSIVLIKFVNEVYQVLTLTKARHHLKNVNART